MPAAARLLPQSFDCQVGIWIRNARIARGWSQPQLAARAESSQSHLSRIERGRTPATVAEFVRLSRLLGHDPAHAIAAVTLAHNSALPLFDLAA